MKKLFVHFALVFACCLAGLPARADVVRYEDEHGKVHYVDDIKKVPQPYQAKVDAKKQLPAISRSRSLDYDLVPGESAGSDVEVYVTSWCPHCKSVEEYLQRRGVQYARYDIEKNSKAKRMYQQYGGGGVPLIRVGTSVLHGFDQADLESALGKR